MSRAFPLVREGRSHDASNPGRRNGLGAIRTTTTPRASLRPPASKACHVTFRRIDRNRDPHSPDATPLRELAARVHTASGRRKVAVVAFAQGAQTRFLWISPELQGRRGATTRPMTLRSSCRAKLVARTIGRCPIRLLRCAC